MKLSVLSSDKSWRTCFGTGYRDSNGFLKTMVTTIHKLNNGGFTFLGFVPESEMLHLGGIPDMIANDKSSLLRPKYMGLTKPNLVDSGFEQDRVQFCLVRKQERIPATISDVIDCFARRPISVD
jgi:hypothetical protein